MSLSLFLMIASIATSQVHVDPDYGAATAKLEARDDQGPWTLELFRRADRSRPDGNGRFHPLYVARMSRDGQSPQITDTRTCPRLVGVVEAINVLPPPDIDIGTAYGVLPEGSGVEPLVIPSPHAPYASLMAQARQPDRTMARVIVTDSGGPVSELAAFVTRQLSECWRDNGDTVSGSRNTSPADASEEAQP